LTLNVSTITTGYFQNDKGVICQCQSKVWEIKKVAGC
jgi:hypothetical protein